MPRRDKTKNQIRERQFSPKLCAADSFRTKRVGERGVQVVLCCPKRMWKHGRCKVSMRAQSIRKPRRYQIGSR